MAGNASTVLDAPLSSQLTLVVDAATLASVDAWGTSKGLRKSAAWRALVDVGLPRAEARYKGPVAEFSGAQRQRPAVRMNRRVSFGASDELDSAVRAFAERWAIPIGEAVRVAVGYAIPRSFKVGAATATE